MNEDLQLPITITAGLVKKNDLTIAAYGKLTLNDDGLTCNSYWDV